MRRRDLLAGLGGLVPIALPVLALPAAEGEAKEARLRRLFRRFMAPCCWRENLLVHHSPVAEALRNQIREDVVAGRTDAEIQAKLVGEFEKRILAMPEGAQGEALRWAPWIAAGLGAAVVVGVIRRSVRMAPAVGAPVDGAELPDFHRD